MAQERIYDVTPGGRIIWGDPNKRATQDYDGNAYEEGKGPFQFGLAIRKDAPGINELLQKLLSQAKAGYHSNQWVLQQIDYRWQSGFAMGDFTFKIKDGDAPRRDGSRDPNAAGCWVFALSTQVPIKVTHWNMVPGVPNNAEVAPDTVYCGAFVDVNMSYLVNEKTDKTAGLYLNPHVVRLLGHGERIMGGMSTEQAFQNAPAPNVPVGASTTPVSPAGGQQTQQPGLPPLGGAAQGAMPGMPGQQPQSAMPGQQQQPHPQQSGGVPGMPGQQPQQQYQPQQQMMPGQQQPGMPGNGQPPMPGQNGNAPLMTPSPSNGAPGMPGQQPQQQYQQQQPGGVPTHPGFLNPPIPGQQ